MRLFPFEKHEFATSSNKTEVVRILERNIDSNYTFGIFTLEHLLGRLLPKKFRGSIDQDSFRMTRIPQWGVNGFIPVTLGAIISSDNGCVIRLKTRYHTLIYIFLFLPLFTGVVSFIDQLRTSESELAIKELFNDQNTQDVMREALSEEDFNAIFNENSFDYAWKDFIIVSLIIYLFLVLLFNYEARILKNDLRKMLTKEKTDGKNGEHL